MKLASPVVASCRDDQPGIGAGPKRQELLAEMVGTTRSRADFFMNKFRKLGSSITTAP